MATLEKLISEVMNWEAYKETKVRKRDKNTTKENGRKWAETDKQQREVNRMELMGRHNDKKKD